MKTITIEIRKMKSIILQSLFGIILFCAALALMLAYFDVLVK